MTYPRLRLAVAVCLFLGWIGYLAYLVARTRDPVVLSRPQLLHTDLVVLAEVEEEGGKPKPEVKVKEVVWAADPEKNPGADTRLRLPELLEFGPKQGWTGARDYLLPLQRKKGGDFQVTPLPWSPGFPSPGEQRIYPATPDAREQLETIKGAS